MNPIKMMAPLAVTLVLGACGGGAVGGGRFDAPVRSFATGPIHSACMRSDRAARSSSLCGCVQATADATLGRSEQARVVAFFRDPHLAQVTRQSDRRGDERFWTRYKQFVSVAERTCA
ncbi:hypothetical protein [Jannaschia rubra]|uniref:hypothetical protein n=1 Tax=Jannaschia rubra TaxID=282197 RepID=UPI0024919B2A|nr:hypothetical protein [Jannaschia rubra]